MRNFSTLEICDVIFWQSELAKLNSWYISTFLFCAILVYFHFGGREKELKVTNCIIYFSVSKSLPLLAAPLSDSVVCCCFVSQRNNLWRIFIITTISQKSTTATILPLFKMRLAFLNTRVPTGGIWHFFCLFGAIKNIWNLFWHFFWPPSSVSL